MLEVDPADNMDFKYQIKILKNEGPEPAVWELAETGKHGEQSLFRFSDKGILIYYNRHAYDKTYEGRHPESHGIYLQEEICFDEEGNMSGWSRWGYFPDNDKFCRTRLDENRRIIDSDYPGEARFKEGDTVYLLYDTGLIEKAEACFTASGWVFIYFLDGIRRSIWVPESCLYAAKEEAEAALINERTDISAAD